MGIGKKSAVVSRMPTASLAEETRPLSPDVDDAWAAVKLPVIEADDEFVQVVKVLSRQEL